MDLWLTRSRFRAMVSACEEILFLYTMYALTTAKGRICI